MLSTSGTGELSKAILSVLDKELYNNMLPIDACREDIRLHGYIGQGTLARGNRSFEITYINGRYVKNKFLFNAIEAAYRERLPINKYPVCVLNLELPPKFIDVNVHPTKTEVKFNNEEEIYGFILNSVEDALNKRLVIPKIAISKSLTNFSSSKATEIATKEIAQNSIVKPQITENSTELSNPKTIINKAVKDIENTVTNEQQIAMENNSLYNTDTIFETSTRVRQLPLINEIMAALDVKAEECRSDKSISKEEELEIQHDFLASLLEDFKIIGQLFNTYILLERESSMYLIDQHAAHERLIYQQLIEEYRKAELVTQALLSPQVINLVGEDYIILMENLDYFNSLGFEIETFGQNTVIVRGVPLLIGRPASFEFIMEIIDEIKDQHPEENRVKELILLKSCKQAIKANDRLSIAEIKQLLYDLSVMKAPLTCPHGRPIVLSLTKYEIEKFFKRIQ